MRCNRKEGRGSKDFKNEGKLGQGVDDLKKGAGTPLQAMTIYIIQSTASINFS